MLQTKIDPFELVMFAEVWGAPETKVPSAADLYDITQLIDKLKGYDHRDGEPDPQIARLSDKELSDALALMRLDLFGDLMVAHDLVIELESRANLKD